MFKISNSPRESTYKKISQEFAKYFYSEILKKRISLKEPNMAAWIEDFERMIHIERRPPEEILDVFHWILDHEPIEDTFSPGKMSKRYTEFLEKSRKRDHVHSYKKHLTEKFVKRLKLPSNVKVKLQRYQVQVFNSTIEKAYNFAYGEPKYEYKLISRLFELGVHMAARNASDFDSYRYSLRQKSKDIST